MKRGNATRHPQIRRPARPSTDRGTFPVFFEPLEGRTLMTASHGAAFGGDFGGHGGHGGGHGGGDVHTGAQAGEVRTITFDQAPSAVQSGLTALATADGLTAPISDQTVTLGSTDGVETYAITLTADGTVSRLTVDEAGNAVNAPTRTTTTWDTLSGTGAGSNAAAAAEISAIATALGLDAPTSTTTIDVTTTQAGATMYSVTLTSSDSSSTGSSTSDDHLHGVRVTVDAAGNPAGNARLPFSVFSSAVQAGINAGAPTGATALASDATDLVRVSTVDGVVVYSYTFSVSGTDTTVNVGTDGSPVTLPTTATVTFADLPSAAQTELQTLATANGVSTMIGSTESVTTTTEIDGGVLYSVTLSATTTDSAGNSHTRDITITVDAAGNPTVIDGAGDHGFNGPGGDFGGGRGRHGGPDDDNSSNSSGSSSSGSSSDSSSDTSSSGSTDSSGLSPSDGSGSTTTASTVAASTSSTSTNAGVDTATGEFATNKVSFTSYQSALKTASAAGGSLASLFVTTLKAIAPGQVSDAVKADLDAIKTDTKTLAADVKALSSADKATYKTDEKAIAAAIKTAGATAAVKALVTTLKTDTATWKATIKADLKAIKADKNDATQLAADQTQLASDQAAALAAIIADQTAITAAIEADTGVTAARAQLASDLPTVADDEATVRADYSQLADDLLAQVQSGSSTTATSSTSSAA